MLFIKTDILISEVEITCIFIFFFASAWNILNVTPGVVIIPTPIIDTLDTFLSNINFLKIIFSFLFIIYFVLFKSFDLIVNVRSVCLPSADIFWTTISTFIEFCESGLNIAAAMPGLSLTPSKVTFASLSV